MSEMWPKLWPKPLSNSPISDLLLHLNEPQLPLVKSLTSILHYNKVVIFPRFSLWPQIFDTLEYVTKTKTKIQKDFWRKFAPTEVLPKCSYWLDQHLIRPVDPFIHCFHSFFSLSWGFYSHWHKLLIHRWLQAMSRLWQVMLTLLCMGKERWTK